jgi:hypothetical protein
VVLSARKTASLAARVLGARFPTALCGFAAGSLIRGDGTEGSDLDLVVLVERLPGAFRQSFTFEGLPVEAFVHDGETLAYQALAAQMLARFGAGGDVTYSRDVSEAVWRAATDPACPMRLPAGADAVARAAAV